MKDLLFLVSAPLRAVTKRWGTTALKQAAWHAEYKRGKHLHDLERHGRSSTCEHVERYAHGGDVLDLGCSDGHVGFGLNPASYRSYTGVDISEIGVKEAQARCQAIGDACAARNRFLVGDISKFVPDKPMDVILFKDSLYYINKLEILGVLNRLRQSLMPNGVFLVQMDNLKRHGWIRELILAHFTVLEDQQFQEQDFMHLVFR